MSAPPNNVTPEKLHKVKFRSGTMDRMCLDEVLLGNEYRLPERMDEYVVIDVGAHCGYFTLACLLRGAPQVLAIEPDAANCQLLRENTADYANRVSLFTEQAAWRSDDDGRTELHFRQPGEGYSAMGTVLCDRGVTVKPVPLDELIGSARTIVGQNLAGRASRILLKIDAEGSEYPCLFTSTLLRHCDVVLGESHRLAKEYFMERDGPPWPMDHAGLCNYLWDLGFRVRSAPRSPHKPGDLVLFWAAQPGVPYFGTIHPQPASPGPDPDTPTGDGQGVSRHESLHGGGGESLGRGCRVPGPLVP